MAKSGNDEPIEPERIDNTLDTVLITALRENFEIKSGCHVDRNEILEFLRSVISDHPELKFVLQHRDTKLSSRIYKAFPKVTTKRVAVPNIRGKKTWTYTNLRRVTNRSSAQSKQSVTPKKTQLIKSSKGEAKGKVDSAESLLMPSSKREKKQYRSKRSVQSASMVQRDSLFETYKRERESSQRSSRNIGSVPQQSYLGRFNDMLKWVKEHYVLNKNSSIQVKRIVEDIKAEFKINITYKQSHKLIFAVFPGTSSRVENPVKIEADGDFYSYKGIAPKSKIGQDQKKCDVAESNSSPSKTIELQNTRKSLGTRQRWVPPDSSPENGRKRIFRTRKRFIEACAVLKPAEEAISRASYDVPPPSSEIVSMGSEMTPRFSNVSPRYPDVSPRLSDVSPRFSDASSKISETSPRCSEVSSRFSDISPRITEVSPGLPNFSPRHSDVSPRFYEVPPIVNEEWRRFESNWQRLYEELKQERDQAILERNQAMVSLMEIEREQVTRTPDDVSRRPTTTSDIEPSSRRVFPKSERRDNPDWLRSLISRSSSMLGEQMSEANAVYFPGSTLQNNSRDQRYPEIERYEQLKQERDAIWKNWIDKLTAEKDDVIQQLKLEKMEVIQRMELEKSDAVESIEEKLTNQITILTREMRELKELLNHTMNERTLAIEHAHKLTGLVSEDSLKEAGLENFPFDLTNDQVVRPTKSKTADETSTQKTFVCFGKGNKRKQSMPAKVKKIPRLESSVSSNLKKHAENIPRNSSQTVSTDSENLLIVAESIDSGSNTDNCDSVAVDNGLVNDRFVDNGVIDTVDDVAADTIDDVATDTIDDVATDTIDDVATDTIDNVATDSIDNEATIECGAVDQSTMVSISPVIDSEKVYPETQAACTRLLRNSLAASAVEHVQSRSVSADSHAFDNSSANVLESHMASTEISRKIEPSVTEYSNFNISGKSDSTPLASNSKNISQSANVVKTEFTNSRSREIVSSDTCSSSEKISPEISRTVNTSVIPENCSDLGNLDTSQKLPSAKNLTTTPSSNSGNSCSENLSVNSQQIIQVSTGNNNYNKKGDCVDLSNAMNHLSETSGEYSPCLLNSGKYTSEPAHGADSSFQKYVGKIGAPNLSLNTEFHILNPGIPGTISTRPDSKRDGVKSFEESVNSTFRKFFPEMPQSSFNSPLTSESSKYFRDTPRPVCLSVASASEKYIQDPGNRTLVYPNENSFPEQNKLSSIDFLNSMVENIGKSSAE